jgi:site-specific DNA recombinase
MMNVILPVSSRAALYLRVSTTRQAEVDLSIPDQKLQTAAYCERQGWPIVAEYVEPGASAMDDSRTEFQRMIERACNDDNPFEVIVVHSFSRSSAMLSALKCISATSPSTACGSSRSRKSSATIRRK